MTEETPSTPEFGAPSTGERPAVPNRGASGRLIAEPTRDFSPRADLFFVALETAPMPTIVTDPRQHDNPIVYANRAFLRLTGYETGDVIGANCRLLQGPDTDAAAVADLRRAIVEGRAHTTEILNYRKDGYSFWNALSVSPVFDESGTLIYFLGSQADVSRRRAAEDELRESQKMEALGRLTGGIAHDFNNLLQVMAGYLELIENGLKKPDLNLPKLQRSIANARGAAERASSLTQQLLTFSRKQRREGRTINLNDLVRSIGTLAERTLGPDVSIETKLAPALPPCLVDPRQIEVTLLNILINARDAMEGRPEKHVTIETQDLVIHHEDMAQHQNMAPGHYCAIAISDTGSGRPIAVVERLLDPFFTTKDDAMGTGLGLPMVYGFAKQSGGLAKVSSVETVGTTVRLYFPAVEPAAAERRKFGRALDRPGDETILLVEDRPDVAKLARTILEDLGYKILHAPDAAAALEALATPGPVDLLIANLVLAGAMSGPLLAREAMRRRPALKILLATGYAEASLERTDAGGSEFEILNEPYGRLELVRKVRAVLDGPIAIG